jgi:hypothetical protein
MFLDENKSDWLDIQQRWKLANDFAGRVIPMPKAAG